MIFESRSKPCIFNKDCSVHLETRENFFVVEVRYKGSIVSYIECPLSDSGYKYANRIYNGMR